MIYFFNSTLKVVDAVHEVGFSYNKKVNREGSGKVDLVSMPHPESLYLSIFNNNDFITSGFIVELQTNNNKVSLSFATFEALLKNYKTPKVFLSFDGMSVADIIANIFHSFLPILKTKKKDFSTLKITAEALLAKGVLHSKNIAFGNVKDGDFHLAFNEEYKAKNEFRYSEKGEIVFIFNLGKPTHVIKKHNIDGKDFSIPTFPTRFLRFSAELGSKTFIKVKAIESDDVFTKWNNDIEKKFNDAAELNFRRDEKDFENRVGCAIPSSKQFVALQFTFIYDKADWVHDYSTLDVYDENNKLVKRTVRGFTPVLHGFEILNRLSIPPFSTQTHTIYFEGKQNIQNKNTPNNGVSGAEELERYKKSFYENAFSQKKGKIKLDGISFYDVLIKILEYAKLNITFELKPIPLNSTGNFSIYIFNEDYNLEQRLHGLSRVNDAKAILRLHDGQYSHLNNFYLKGLRKKIEPYKMLHCYGEGKAQDILYLCLFMGFDEKKEEEKIYLYSTLPVCIPDAELEKMGVERKAYIPENTSFIEERFEDATQKTFQELLVKSTQHLIEEQKKKIESFELDSSLNIRLFDYVLLLHQKSETKIEARIVEEKISLKNGKIQKTFGVGGFLFNPFDALFGKPKRQELTITPLSPYNLRAYTSEKKLFLAWDSRSASDGFIVEVLRIDGSPFASHTKEPRMFFHCKDTEIAIDYLDLKILYKISIVSFIDREKSEPSESIYARLTDEPIPIRILKNLSEIGSKEGEVAFFLDIEFRKENWHRVMESLQLKTKEELIKYNHADELKEKLENAYDLDAENVRHFLGLEYVWQNDKWIDRRIREPRRPPLFYFDFKEENISVRYKGDEDYRISLLHIVNSIKELDEIRQQLTYLSKFFKLPEHGTVETFSLQEPTNEFTEEPRNNFTNDDFMTVQNMPSFPRERSPSFPGGGRERRRRDWGGGGGNWDWGNWDEGDGNEYDWGGGGVGRWDPPSPPSPPSPPPNPPHEPPHNYKPKDEREDPSVEQKTYWQNNKGRFDELKRDLLKSLQRFHSKYGSDIQSIQASDARVLDISGNSNHLHFTYPLFSYIHKSNTFVPNYIWPNISFKKVSLYGGATFMWKSTLLTPDWDHEISDKLMKPQYDKNAWPYNKPSFFIKKLTKDFEDEAPDTEIEWVGADPNLFNTKIKKPRLKHTLSFWLNFHKTPQGDFEIWNVCNYNVGRVKDGNLCIGAWVEDIGTKKKEFVEIWKDDIKNFQKYSHIVVVAEYTNFSLDHELYINLKVYINGVEYAKLECKPKHLSSYNLVIPENDFMLFNIKDIKKTDEVYTKEKRHNYNVEPLPYFFADIYNLVLYPHCLSFGERQYLYENIPIPLKRPQLKGQENKNNEIPKQGGKKHVYVGVCIDEVSATGNKVTIYGKGVMALKEGEFFLMGKNYETFKVGLLYRWTDKKWESLFPFSRYEKEYFMALSDVANMKEVFSNIFFKDFMMNMLLITEGIYTKHLDTRKLVAHRDVFFYELMEEDMKYEGMVYKDNNGYLRISKG
ncbi:MAG: hypothetical protein ACTTKH_05590 [Treponema sp.]